MLRQVWDNSFQKLGTTTMSDPGIGSGMVGISLLTMGPAVVDGGLSILTFLGSRHPTHMRSGWAAWAASSTCHRWVQTLATWLQWTSAGVSNQSSLW